METTICDFLLDANLHGCTEEAGEGLVKAAAEHADDTNRLARRV